VLQFLPRPNSYNDFGNSNSANSDDRKDNKQGGNKSRKANIKNNNSNSSNESNSNKNKNNNSSNSSSAWWADYLTIYHQVENCNQSHLIEQVWGKLYQLAMDIALGYNDNTSNEVEGVTSGGSDRVVDPSGAPVLSFDWIISLFNCLLHNQIPTIRKLFIFRLFTGKVPLNYKDYKVLRYISEYILVSLNNPLYFPTKVSSRGFDDFAFEKVMDNFQCESLHITSTSTCTSTSSKLLCTSLRLADILRDDVFNVESATKAKSHLLVNPGCLIPAFISHILSELVSFDNNSTSTAASAPMNRRIYFVSNYINTVCTRITSTSAATWMLHAFSYGCFSGLILNCLGSSNRRA
jgi:hypothetical protein